MTKIHNLTGIFERETEILEVKSENVIYAIDNKSEQGNQCIIGTYNFQTGEINNVLTLDGTRIYESFCTYALMKDYFYAVIVGESYRLRLQKIEKYSWRCSNVYDLVPEGEVLNIYPVSDDYLIVTDEVIATDELLLKFDDEAYEGKYYTLVYLYCLKTGEKYYLNTAFEKNGLVDVWRLPVSGENSQMIFLLQNQELLTVSLEDLADGLKNNQHVPLIRIEEASENHQLMRVASDEDRCLYRVHDAQAGKDVICSLNIEHGQVTKHVIRTEMMPETGEIVYDPDNASVYRVTSSEQGMMHIENLSHPDQTFTYNSEYGEFTGIATSDLLVTRFYDTQMLKDDMVFKECVAIHHIQDGTVEIFEGTCEKRNGQLLILKSFLFL